MKIKKGDIVKILSGKDRGKQGKIVNIDRKEGKVIVEGVNIVSKHIRQTSETEKGGIINTENPINISKVMLICPSCMKSTRVGYKIDSKGNKKRICKKCKKVIK